MVYIKKAKVHVNSADAVALTILSEYNNWVNLQKTFLDSGLGQLNEIEGSGNLDSPEQVQLWEDQKNQEYMNTKNKCIMIVDVKENF